MTRAALSSICERLYDQEPLLYSKVSLTTLRNLELGQVRPRARTAAVIAKALGSEPPDLFPLGTDDPRRNPAGNTKITPGRQKGGRQSAIE